MAQNNCIKYSWNFLKSASMTLSIKRIAIVALNLPCWDQWSPKPVAAVFLFDPDLILTMMPLLHLQSLSQHDSENPSCVNLLKVFILSKSHHCFSPPLCVFAPSRDSLDPIPKTRHDRTSPLPSFPWVSPTHRLAVPLLKVWPYLPFHFIFFIL